MNCGLMMMNHNSALVFSASSAFCIQSVTSVEKPNSIKLRANVLLNEKNQTTKKTHAVES